MQLHNNKDNVIVHNRVTIKQYIDYVLITYTISLCVKICFTMFYLTLPR